MVKENIHGISNIALNDYFLDYAILRKKSQTIINKHWCAQMAHQLNFIGGDEGGHHRNLLVYPTFTILYKLIVFFLRQRLVFL